MVLAAGSSQGGPCEERAEADPTAAQLLQLQDCPTTAPKLSPPAVLAGALCLKKVKNQYAAAVAEGSEENARENTADTKVS